MGDLSRQTSLVNLRHHRTPALGSIFAGIWAVSWTPDPRGQADDLPGRMSWRLHTVGNPSIDPAGVEAAKLSRTDEEWRQGFGAEFPGVASGKAGPPGSGSPSRSRRRPSTSRTSDDPGGSIPIDSRITIRRGDAHPIALPYGPGHGGGG